MSLSNTETYRYATLSGDEAGARISSQARHYSVSEIRRDSATGWMAIYVYQPNPGFVGADSVGLELLSGSDGASLPSSVRKVLIRFTVHG